MHSGSVMEFCDKLEYCQLDLVSYSCGTEMHMTDASGSQQIKHDTEMRAAFFATKRKMFVALPGGGSYSVQCHRV